MKNRPALDELPTRAQCGYVLKYGHVKKGEMTPGTVAGILHAKRLVDDLDEAKEIAAEVLDARGGEPDE